MTVLDESQWRAWKRERKLADQRGRRKRYRRVDYYPSKAAQAVIDAHCGPWVGGDYSSVIDALVVAGAGRIPE